MIQQKNLRDCCGYAEKYLEAAGVTEARQNAWLLLEYVTGETKTRYLAFGKEITISKEVESRYMKLVKKRAAHIPLQYIIGIADFMGLTFSVTEDVLIPRADTEILAEKVINKAKPGQTILDLCTGSGCIILSIIKLGKNLRGTGTDLSLKALDIARRNALRLGIDVNFIQSNLFAQVTGNYDIITSNPPYIPSGQIRELMPEIRDYEPHMALDGGRDGLNFYREIISKAMNYLNPGGEIFLEIGWDQGQAVSVLMKEAGFKNVEIIKDLSGLDRVVTGGWNV